MKKIDFRYEFSRVGILLLVAVFLLAHWMILPSLPLARKIPAWFAALSMSSMALSFVLAARWKWIERFTGGLDKSYRLHRFLGVFALLTMVGHWLLVPGGAGMSPFPFLANIGEDLGEIAVFVLLFAIVVSAIRFLPYRAWKYTHYLMGPAFLLAVLHTFFSDIPLALGSLAWLVILFVSGVGIFAWFDKLLSDLRRQPTYRVQAIERHDDYAVIEYEPLHDPISHKAGQFAFVSFEQDGLHEMHPFTIASAPNENGSFRMVVKGLGDYTTKLVAQLQEGVLVKVDGGFGRFLFERGRARQIWVAGGVGITPFLAAIQAEGVMKSKEIDLVIVSKGKKSLILDHEIAQAQARYPNFKVHYVLSEEGQRFSLDDLASPEALRNAGYYFCGPAGLRDSLIVEMQEKDISLNRLHYELFDMRGEIDVRLHLSARLRLLWQTLSQFRR